MCLDGVVEGSKVYIDTKEGVNATGIDSGTACECFVSTQNAKLTSATTFFDGYVGEECGTNIKYEHMGTAYTIGQDSCYTLVSKFDTRVTTNFTADLVRDMQPYKSDYCLVIEPGMEAS